MQLNPQNPHARIYCKIRKNSKAPMGRDWQHKPYAWAEIANDVQSGRCGYGIIYQDEYAGIDIDNQHGLDTFVNHFGVTPYELSVVSWFSGKCFDGSYSEEITPQSNITLLFRLDAEQQSILKKRLAGYKNSFDIRHGLNQSVLPSHNPHPDTGKPYQWHHSPLDYTIGTIPDLEGLIAKIIAYKLEHDPASVYDSGAHEEKIKAEQKSQEAYLAYLAGENPTFKHTPTTFMKYEIEPHYQDYPELLYDGGKLGNHGFLSSYQSENRQHLTRLAGHPLWRESSSGKSLILFAVANPITNTKNWYFRDHGTELGGNVLKYRHYLNTGISAYPNTEQGWEICNYYINKLKKLGDVDLELPNYSQKKGVIRHNPLHKPDRYFVSHLENKIEGGVLYWSDFVQGSPETFRDDLIYLMDFWARDKNEPLKIIVTEHDDILEIYKFARLAGAKAVIDRRGMGSGKSYVAGSLEPSYFNFQDEAGNDITEQLGLQVIRFLRYIHPQNHRNPTTTTLANWSLEPVRKGGEVLTPSGKKERYKDPSQHQIEPANCIRHAAFEKSYEFNLDLQTLDEKGNEVNLLCKTCPVYQQCVAGEGNYTYLYQKRIAQSNPKTRIHPDSLGNPENYSGHRKGFNFKQAIGIFDEIDSHEKQQSYRLNAAQFRSAFDKLNTGIQRANMNRTLVNEQARYLPASVIEWIELIARLLSGDTEAGVTLSRYGVAPNHELFTEPLDIVNHELDFLTELLDHAKHNIIDHDLDFFNDGRDLHDAVVYQYSDDGRIIGANLDQAKALENTKSLINVGEANLIIDLIRIRCGYADGVMNIEQIKTQITNESGESEDQFSYELVYSVPNERYTKAFNSFDMSIILDATTNPNVLVAEQGLELNKTIQIVKSEPIPENLKITQIVGLGRLGMQRGDDIQSRLGILVNQLKQNYNPDEIGIFEFKKFHTESGRLFGVWGRDNRGSNEFQDCIALIVIGCLTPNLNAIIREFGCIYKEIPTPETELIHRKINQASDPDDLLNFYTSCNHESTNEQFREFVFHKIQSETSQCFGRLRANRRHNQDLTIYYISDFPTQYPVEVKYASELSPELLDKKSRNYHLVYESIQTSESRLTQTEIAQKTGLSSSTVSRAIRDYQNGTCEDWLLAQFSAIRDKITEWELIRVTAIPETVIHDIEFTQNLIETQENLTFSDMKLNAFEPEYNTSGLYAAQKPEGFESGSISPENARNIVWATPITDKKTRATGKIDYLNIDENLLNLFQSANYTLPQYTPKEITPYADLNFLFCDIETVPLPEYIDDHQAALNPETGRIIHIGLKGSGHWGEIYTHEDERVILEAFIHALNHRKQRLDGLILHNGHNFDIPFIAHRCDVHGIAHPFKKDYKKTTVNATSVFGSPISVYQWRFDSDWKAGIIDTYILLAIEDNVKRQLDSLTLKKGALVHGRLTERLELNHNQIREYWYSRNPHLIQLITDYLEYDLEDTQLIANDLLPAFYYQLKFVPDANLQDMIATGNGAKWNKILTYEIGKERYDSVDEYFRNRPKPTQTAAYEGGKTYGKAGIHRNVGKLDVASMHPAIMLKYGIKPAKDEGYKTLAILKYLRDERIRNKDIAGGKINKPDGTPYSEKERHEANLMQSAMKVLINSAYGFMGVQTNYNDPVAACLVTAYSRAILDLMVAKTEEFGGEILEIDTDGVIFKMPELSDPVDNHRQFTNLCEQVKASMPDGIDIDDLEFFAKGIYVPLSKDIDPETGTGQRKNYIVLFDQTVTKPKKHIIKGRFRKRDRCKLENEFTPKFIEKFVLDSPQVAESYYNETLRKIKDGTVSRDDLRITKTVPKSDKKYARIGLKPGEKFNGWIGANGVETMNEADGYSIWHYQQIIKDRYNEIMAAYNIESESMQNQQLSLF